MATVSIATLREYVAKWAALLGLGRPDDGGWGVSVKWAAPAQIADGLIDNECAGACVWQVEYKSATVWLNRKHCASRPAYAEATVLHELLHLRLEGHLEQPAPYDAHYEFALNVLTEALMGER